MRILLDTHILLWALTNDPRLCEHARELILDEKNEIYYSILSLWETELKRLARPDAITVTAKELSEYCAKAGYMKLPLQEQHIFALENLRRKPDAPVHKNSFDRLLICQACAEGMILITHDALISDYEEQCILAV